MSFLGKAILAFWADVDASGEADYNDWHTREHMPERCGVPGFLRGRRYVAVAAAHLCEADVETTTVKTAEKSIRDKPDEVARWVLLVEGTDADIVQRACAEALGAKALEAHGAEPGAITGIYALHYIL